MSLYKRTPKGNWHCKFQVGNQTVRRSTRTKNKKDAAAAEARYRKLAYEQIVLGIQKRTFDEACARWLDEKASKRSLHSDESHIRWLREHLPADFMLTDFGPDVIHQLRQAKLAGDTPGRPNTKSTVNRAMAFLRSLLNVCVNEWGWLEHPVRIPMYRIPKGEPRWLTPEEFEAFVEHLPYARQLAARFAVATGLRSAPIRKMEWTQIKGDELRIRISQSKNEEPLTIPLNAMAMEVLDDCRGRDETLVFVDDEGKPLRREMVDKAWRRAIKASDLDHFRFHDLRHTWASWHVQNGTPLHVLKELGGWKSLDMVLKYAHLAPATHRQWAGNVA
ncbi:MAG: site-specific integrase [Pseudomonadota bacterium]